MINTLKHGALLITAIFMVATPAHSQAPTDAQRNAIRSQCRAPTIAIQSPLRQRPPGGEASLQCLQTNMSSLSSGCQGAVRAVEPAAAPKAETAPAAASSRIRSGRRACCRNCCEARGRAPAPAPKAAATTTANKPTDAQAAAARSACRTDYQKVCASVPTGGSSPAMPREEQGPECRRPVPGPSTPPEVPRPHRAAPRRPRARERPQSPRPRRPSCYGRCGHARNCSS